MKNRLQLENALSAVRRSMKVAAKRLDKEVYDEIYNIAAVIEWTLELNSESARDVELIINTALRMDEWRRPS